MAIASLVVAVPREGLVATGSPSLLGLFLDARRIGDRPFAWARQIAQSSISKFGLLIIALLLGGAAYAFVHLPAVFYGVFVLLKLTADLHDVLQKVGREELSNLPSRFGSWVGYRLGGEAAANVRRADREQASEDERLSRMEQEDERCTGRVPAPELPARWGGDRGDGA